MIKKTLILLLSLAPLCGEEADRRCCVGIEAGADFLYWKPCGTEIDYAAALYPVPEDGAIFNTRVHYHDFNPKWTPGLRGSLSILHLFSSLDLRADYTYLSDITRRSVENPNAFLVSPLIHKAIVPLVNPEAELQFTHANGVFDYNYHRWDAFFQGHYEIACGQLVTHYLVGASGLILNRSFDSNFWNPAIPTIGMSHSWNSHLWAVGLNIGTELDFYTSCFSKLFIRANGLLLAGSNTGDTTHYFLQDEEEDQWLIKDPSYTHMAIPGCDLSAGIDYGLWTSNKQLNVRFGYQFTGYWNVPAIRGFLGRDNGMRVSQSTPLNTGFFGFHGLFVGLNAGF